MFVEESFEALKQENIKLRTEIQRLEQWLDSSERVLNAHKTWAIRSDQHVRMLEASIEQCLEVS